MIKELAEKLVKTALASGAKDAAVTEVAKIPFRREFRAACEKNICGFYNRSYMCPPDVGEIDDLIERAKKYQYVLVFQTVGHLEDSFDIVGMQETQSVHSSVTQALSERISEILTHPLKLGAGACSVCKRCGKAESVPCRFPAKALASLESYGIAVSELAQVCGLNYMNGQNTVTYFGAFLFE